MRWSMLAAIVLSCAACAAPMAQEQRLDTQVGPITSTIVARGLEHPWALAFLPDGRMLVTERPGRLRLVDRAGTLSPPLGGVPAVVAQGQGGLLDIALDPRFVENRLVYLSYAEAGDGGAGTAVARGRLGAQGLEGLQVIFRQLPKVSGGNHFGSRLVFARDGTLFVVLGERFKFDPAQDLSAHLGKVVRINADGSVPRDNPLVGRIGVRPEIWSYGHRNPQGAALHPQTGALWEVEHGPRGGDELNIPEAGKNYGWPLVSWGDHYNGQPIPKPGTRPDLAPSVRHWVPSISPSGMAFYTADLIPAWRGSLFLGGLTSGGLTRLTLEGDKVTSEERIRVYARIRDVRQGPDGALYALTDEDDGKLLRFAPAR